MRNKTGQISFSQRIPKEIKISRRIVPSAAIAPTILLGGGRSPARAGIDVGTNVESSSVLEVIPIVVWSVRIERVVNVIGAVDVRFLASIVEKDDVRGLDSVEIAGFFI
jgi:hypothetical protein